MSLVTSIELKLDNVNYIEVPFNDPLTISKNLGEELDSGGFNVWLEREAPITPFTECRIILADDSVSYWYASSTSEQINFTGTIQYEHKVDLIEPTKILERYYIGAKTFSNPLTGTPKTILEILEILRDITPLSTRDEVLAGTNIRWDIDTSITTRLSNIDAREFTFTPDKMQLEILAEIGEFIGAYPRMIDFETLSFDFYSDLLTELEDGDYSSKLETLLEGQYHNSLVSNIQNIIPETQGNASSIQTVWRTPRNDSGNRISTADNMYILVDNPIYGKLPKLYVTNLTLRTISSGDITFNYPTVIELSDFLLEKQQYDTLSVSDRSFAIYYNQDDNKIDGLLYEIFGRKFAIELIIQDAAADQFPLGGGDLYIDLIDPDLWELPFSVDFSPTTSILSKKTKQTENNKDLDLMYNQSENITDAISFGEALIDKSARLGVRTYEKTFVSDGLIGIKELGTFNSDNFFADGYNLYFWNNFKEQTVSYSNDYVKLSEFVGVNSQIVFSNVPQTGDIVERKLHINEFCIISDTKTTDNQTVSLSDDGLARIGGVFNPIATRTTSDKQVSWAKIQTYDDIASEFPNIIANILLNVSSIGFGDTIHLNFKTEDNFSAGLTTEVDSGDRYSKGHPYSDIDGEAISMSLIIGPELILTSSQLQIVAESYPDVDFVLIADLVGDIIFSTGANSLYIKKDAREAINYNHQIQFIPDASKFVLGASFTENNTFVADTSTTELYLWLLDYNTGKFNRKKIDTTQATMQPHANFVTAYEQFGTDKTGILTVRQVTTTPLASHTSYAIGDADGNLYLAVNEQLPIASVGGVNLSTKYFNYRNKL